MGSAEVELRVFELTWLDNANVEQLNGLTLPATKNARNALVGNSYIKEEDAQGNVLFCRRFLLYIYLDYFDM